MTRNYIHKIKNSQSDLYTFIILSAGKIRFKECSSSIALYPVEEKQALIDHQIKTIQSVYKNFEIVLIVGFDCDKIIEHCGKYKNVRLIENINYRKTSALDSLKIAMNCTLKSNTFVIYGDKTFNKHSIKCELNKTCVYINKKNSKVQNLGVSYDKNEFINMCYGLPNSWAEIVYIPQSNYQLVKNELNSAKKNKIFTFEKFINKISNEIKIYVNDSNNINIMPVKEIDSENFVLQSK